jgi:hypothetical protein
MNLRKLRKLYDKRLMLNVYCHVLECVTIDGVWIGEWTY